MTDLYEELGVDKKATPEQIKKAYKRKASKAHPDKGGDSRAMVVINDAYKVLGDPEKRAHYDATGQETLTPLDAEIQNDTLQLIRTVLESDEIPETADVVGTARNMANERLRAIQNGTADLRRKIKKYEKRRKSIKSTDEKNMFHMVIDQRLGDLHKAIGLNQHAEQVVKGTLAVLKHYSDNPEVFSFNMSSSTGGPASLFIRSP